MAEEKAEEKAEVDSPAPEEVGFPVSGKESLQGTFLFLHLRILPGVLFPRLLHRCWTSHQ